MKRFFCLLNSPFAMAILNLISHVHLPSFVNMLHKYLKHFTFSSWFWSIIIVTGDICLEILITFVFSTFISNDVTSQKSRVFNKVAEDIKSRTSLERVRAPIKIFFRAPHKGELTKNLYSQSERLTLGCRLTWPWPESINLYSGQLMTPQTTKHVTMWTSRAPEPVLEGRTPAICTVFNPLVSTAQITRLVRKVKIQRS